MFGSNILEIAIGIIFVFILVSTICTIIREGIEAKLKTRAAYLEQGIRQLLNDRDGTGLAKALYEHPLINGLFNGNYIPGKQNQSPNLLARGGDLPSYIPSKSFAAALMDLAAQGVNGADTSITTGARVITLAAIRASVVEMKNQDVQRVLLYAIDNAQGDLNKAQANIEDWYNSSMDRVSGWYKRSSQWIILWIALAVTISLNVNTIKVIKYLAKNDTERKMVVASAEAAAKDTTSVIGYKAAQAHLNTLKLPIGWEEDCLKSAKMTPNAPDDFWNSFMGPLLGWLITVFVATLGAPFWFDMLNKVMVIRSTVKPQEKSIREIPRNPQTSQAPVININSAPAQQPAAGENLAAIQDQPAPDDNEIDGCEVIATELTGDADLPESKGGMV
jgi:hypothetical protein